MKRLQLSLLVVASAACVAIVLLHPSLARARVPDGSVQVPPPPPPPQNPSAPARDTAQPRTGTSRIRGRVLAADTGAPVRRAIVRLSSPDLRDSRSAMTDGEGRYEFRDLPSGSYAVIASKTGFQTLQLGAREPGEVGKTLKVGDAQVVANADIVLARSCAIAGRVLDEFGDPVANVMVRVFRYQSLGGSRRMVGAGSSGGGTNDLGQYRVFGLAPGTYYVSAQASMGGEIEVADRTGYAPTYYPGTPDVSQAQAIQVSTGQDVTNIDIMLSLVRTARISGIALDSQGRPAANAGISAVIQQSGTLGGGMTSSYGRVQSDATFTIMNLSPGDYVLTMTLPNQNRQQMEFGRARVTVAGSDISGVMIQSSLGGTVSGQVSFEGTSAPPQAKLSVTTTQGSVFDVVPAPSAAPAQVREDGSFTLTGLFGERLIRISGQPGGWMLKAVYVNGRDVIDTPLSFEGREQIAGAQLVLTDRITHITGTVNDDRGQPAEIAYVLVFADDPTRWSMGSRFQRSTTAREGAPLKIDGLPPGDYIGVALKSTQGIDPYDPEFLERMRKVGAKFSLREGETRDLTLKLIDLAAK